MRQQWSVTNGAFVKIAGCHNHLQRFPPPESYANVPAGGFSECLVAPAIIEAG